MIEFQGVGLVWSGLSLWGCALGGSSSSCPAARAQHGIKVNKPAASAPGTGKAWFDSILIAHCKEAIATTNTLNNDTLAFGFCWFDECDVGLHLTGAQSLQYTFQHVLASDVERIFKVTQGGRISTQTVSVVSDDTIVMDLIGGGSSGAFHQLGGVTIDENATGVTLLTSAPPASGGHHVRFTNGHFRNNMDITVDRTGGGGVGQTTLELVGCRGVGSLEDAITLKGKNTSGHIVLIVRDCDISDMADTDIATLINSNSSNWRAWSRENWTFASGKVGNTNDSNP
jgi:hypothetical protein